jgi:pyruvate-formate lyase
MENLLGILLAVLIFVAFIALSKRTSKKEVDSSLTNDVDKHLEICNKNAEIREQKAQEKLEKLRKKNEETRNRTNKVSGLIELGKKTGKSEAQKEEELAQAIQSGWLYKK